MGAMRHWCTSAALLLFFVPFVLAQQPPDSLLKIDEPNVRFHLLPKPELELPVVNLSRQRLEGKFPGQGESRSPGKPALGFRKARVGGRRVARSGRRAGL